MHNFARRLLASRTVAFFLFALASPLHALADALKRRIIRHVRRNGGRVVYDGVPLIFPPNVGVGFSSSIAWRGVRGFEPYTWREIKARIPSVGTFIDVGANIGFYSVLAKKIAPRVDVISFEPLPDNCSKADAFHRSNRVEPNIKQLALGDFDGMATLYQPGSELESTAATLRPDSWQARKGHISHRVPVARLDTLMADRALSAPVLMKIDVEDNEAAVISGARETIRKYRPTIVCEILPREHHNAATLDLLSELGYVAYAILAEGCFRVDAADFTRPRAFVDFLLVPKEMARAHYI